VVSEEPDSGSGTSTSPSSDGGGTVRDTSIIEEVLKQFEEEKLVDEGKFEIILEPGEVIERTIWIRNDEDFEKEVIIKIPRELKPFVRVSDSRIVLGPKERKEITIWFNIPEDSSVQMVTGSFLVTAGVTVERVEVTLQLREGSRILELRTLPLKQLLGLGEKIQLKTTITNRRAGTQDITMVIKVKESETEEEVFSITKEYSIKERLELTEEIDSWPDQKIGEYVIDVEVFFTNDPIVSASSLNLITIQEREVKDKFLSYKTGFFIFLLIFLAIGSFWLGRRRIRKKKSRPKSKSVKDKPKRFLFYWATNKGFRYERRRFLRAQKEKLLEDLLEFLQKLRQKGCL
jgi:hypothetical protein